MSAERLASPQESLSGEAKILSSELQRTAAGQMNSGPASQFYQHIPGSQPKITDLSLLSENQRQF